MLTFTTDEKHSGQRLDHVLTEQMEITRSQIQKLIKSAEITVNEKKSTAKYLLLIGDVVSYPYVDANAPIIKTGPPPELDILFEDDNVLVINKPAGLIVHQATPQDTQPNVVDALLKRQPSIIEVGDDETRPGIVHRLDKDVSGVMVTAKTQEAFEHLKKQFQERTIKKEYFALVYGKINKDTDTITLKIARSKILGRMVARPESQEGKDAITEFDILDRFVTTTYLNVKIHTGRTHQIRVHFLAIDHPLVGDRLYKKTRMKNIRHLELNRIFLHAHNLEFTLPDGTVKTFEIPLPSELQAILDAQKSNV